MTTGGTTILLSVQKGHLEVIMWLTVRNWAVRERQSGPHPNKKILQIGQICELAYRHTRTAQTHSLSSSAAGIKNMLAFAGQIIAWRSQWSNL